MQLAWSENEVQDLHGALIQLKATIAQKMLGQEQVLEQVLLAMMAGGHALIEGVPGLGKTLLVKSIAESISLDFKRIQFTPDLMPSDVIGTELLEEDAQTGKRVFRFQKGPIFTQILLADEINRTPPKTQSALLEAMQEGSVTFAGERHVLPKPFFVLATQNPIEQAGTYPLPEAQLDRFLLHITVPYPDADQECAIVMQTTGVASQSLQAVMDQQQLQRVQQLVRELPISERLVRYAVTLVRETRPQDSGLSLVRDYLSWGAGTRAAQSLVLCAKAHAVLHGRLAVSRDDLRAVLGSVLRHRLVFGFQAEADNIRFADVLDALLQIPMPA